ncbi:MAG: AAA domain-containing protein [Acidobacteriota bacterium]
MAELESVCESVRKIPLPPENLLPDTYKALVSEVNRDLLKTILNVFENFVGYETTLDKFTARISHLRSIGSEMCRDAITELQGIGLDKYTIESLRVLNSKNQLLATRISGLESFCNTIRQTLNLQDTHVPTMRAAVTGIELLGELNRQLWVKRSPPLLTEEDHSLLENAAEEAATLLQHRTRLEFEFDLQFLPSINELRSHIVALKTKNVITSLLSWKCHKAKRVYRSMARNNQKKSLPEMAEALLSCAQYLVDAEKICLNSELKYICGNNFNGLDTPFEDLMRVASWAKEVWQRLACFGDTGLHIRDFLFNRTPDELDRYFSLREQSSFELLTTILDEIIENDNTEWHELVRQQRIRANKLSDSLKTFELASFRDTCSEEDILAAVDALDSAEKARSSIEVDTNCLQLVGGTFDTLRENHEALSATLEFARDVSSSDISRLYVEYLFADPSNVPEFQSAAQDLQSACSNVAAGEEQTRSFAQLDPDLWCGAESFTVIQLTQLLVRNQFATEHISFLRDYLNFLLAENAAFDQGIGPVLSVYSSNNLDYFHLRLAVESVFYRSAAEAILQADDQLKKHFGTTHQELRERFQKLDEEYFELSRKLLANKLYQRPCPAGNSVGPVANLTELALVKRIASQTRPRISVRDLISRAGKAIQELKPCWMMSPMSVAQYTEPGKLFFDLIIMDEASQIRVEEAIGGIARGKKAIIVGDQAQLPPTTFSQKLSSGNYTEDDKNEEEREDSVLEAAAGRFHPLRRLKCHYRSEHESLFKFSNTEFYNNQLIIFPSPYYDHPEYGVSLEQIDGIYESGINKTEGKAVVDAAINFMKECPEQSLGIVAVNSKQAEFMREELDREITLNAQAAAFVQNWEPTLEPLFVKNLENVQGDERDVIFISTVYGKDQNGNFYQRYGPINSDYGHRGLNVLFTRAKKRIKIFTSMYPHDIQDEEKHWGVKVLKEYLQFAHDGFSINMNEVGGECQSEFEHWILQVLRSYGYEGVPQVGVCGYHIDIAVRHPGKPGVFLCGIECDSATYHGAPSVRERDRLRQEILEKYGWKIYRIWSTDWFRNPGFQTRQLLGYLQELHPPMLEQTIEYEAKSLMDKG